MEKGQIRRRWASIKDKGHGGCGQRLSYRSSWSSIPFDKDVTAAQTRRGMFADGLYSKLAHIHFITELYPCGPLETFPQPDYIGERGRTFHRLEEQTDERERGGDERKRENRETVS